jgi:isoquinoline 1-oxidoreductase beta subunit
VAEVEVAANGSLKVHRIVCAVDCGMVVNPDTIEAQVQGGTFFGLTAALYGVITLKNGRVEQGNFDTYRPLRIDEAPVGRNTSGQKLRGPRRLRRGPDRRRAPAVTNAIFAATAKRIRTLPIDTNLLKSAG